MKRKVKGKVLKKIKREKAVHSCYFCNSTKRITKHHIIFKVFLQGKTLDDNIEYLCSKCHKKFHTLAMPVINTLVDIIEKLQPTKTRPIGFLRNGYDKGGKRNEKEKKTKK